MVRVFFNKHFCEVKVKTIQFYIFLSVNLSPLFLNYAPVNLFCYINTTLRFFHFQLGGCTTIPESDLEERTVIPGSTAAFPSHGQIAKQKSKPGKQRKIMLFYLEAYSLSFQDACGRMKQMTYFSGIVNIIFNFSCDYLYIV